MRDFDVTVFIRLGNWNGMGAFPTEKDKDDPIVQAVAYQIGECIVCDCGQGHEAPLAYLRELLDCFDRDKETAQEFINTQKIDCFMCTDDTYGPMHLTLCLLECLGFVEHSGSVDASSYLTDAGSGLKWALNQDWLMKLAYPGNF